MKSTTTNPDPATSKTAKMSDDAPDFEANARRVRVLPSARKAVTRVEEVAESIFASIDALGQEFLLARSSELRRDCAFGSVEMTQLQPKIFKLLDTVPAMHSAGLFVAEDILEDRFRNFEWWQRTGTEQQYEPLLLDLDPTSSDCYDYYEMEWFKAANTTGARHVTSPRIDLPCSSVLVMTFATPMVADMEFLGIAGADVTVSRLEGHLLEALSKAGQPCVLLNNERRVIASTTPLWLAGDRLGVHPNEDTDPWLMALKVTPDLGWTLAILDN